MSHLHHHIVILKLAGLIGIGVASALIGSHGGGKHPQPIPYHRTYTCCYPIPDPTAK